MKIKWVCMYKVLWRAALADTKCSIHYYMRWLGEGNHEVWGSEGSGEITSYHRCWWEWPQRSSSLASVYNQKGNGQKVRPKSPGTRGALGATAPECKSRLLLPHFLLTSILTCSVLLVFSWDMTWTSSKPPWYPLIGIVLMDLQPLSVLRLGVGADVSRRQRYLQNSLLGKGSPRFSQCLGLASFSQHHSSQRSVPPFPLTSYFCGTAWLE